MVGNGVASLAEIEVWALVALVPLAPNRKLLTLVTPDVAVHLLRLF